MSVCDALAANASDGVASALSAVDCLAGESTAQAFGRLFGGAGGLLPVLTIVLTLYIAFFAISLLTGRTGVGISALMGRTMLVGLVLTFVTSWVAYQQVVWNLAAGAPDQIAGVVMGMHGSATQIFAERIDMLFAAITEAANGAAGDQAAPAQAGAGMVANLPWLSALLLVLGTAGVLVAARIALAVLLAIGPVFVVFTLFPGTRGLFAGWLRGVLLTAMTPLFVVTGGGLMIELLVPIVAALRGPDGIDQRAALALFMFVAVYLVLLVMVLKIAGSVVSSWDVFGLSSRRPGRGMADGSAFMVPGLRLPGFGRVSGPSRGSSSLSMDLAAAGGLMPNIERGRGGRVVVTGLSIPAPGHAPGSSAPSGLRTRGIGSRFRTGTGQFREFVR